MLIEAPASRYRVIERDGRLVVFDTVMGGAPLTARDLLPDGGEPFARDPFPRDDVEPEDRGAARIAETDNRARPQVWGPATRPDRPSAADPPNPLGGVAATIAGDRRDNTGRLLLTTARWYDAKGPRTLALSAAAER